MRLTFVPIHVFRETPAVTFFDASVPESNGSDVVLHTGAAVSPPDAGGFQQFYVHAHQIDHNLVLQGRRTYTLLNPAWPHVHHVVHLERVMGALQIPTGTYHRSVSGEEGSLVLNQATRDPEFTYATEFIPVNVEQRPDLQAALAAPACVWRWRNGHICRDPA
ncbi:MULTISPECIES: hypothetical protein [Aphanothece]|uniref:hypothetical protein n=1 Tax=Aphanothece TaxID=1121 RepID=UPI00398F6CC0